MKVWAISDLHFSYKENRALLADLPDFGDDWLIVAGDVGEKTDYHHFAWSELTKHFAKIFWTPGNHDLWTMPHSNEGKGQHKYASLIKIAREYGVITPEDPFCKITMGEQTYCIVPLFTLYDYSFRPGDVPAAKALDWAHEARIYSNDENYLFSSPFSSVPNWARARFKIAEERLGALPPELPLIVVTHYPLLSELCRLYRIPRYSIWCGSKITESWISKYNISMAISGHMHMRATDYRLGVRFEEVSLGYPRDWRKGRTLKSYLRQILPNDTSHITGATMWRP